MSAAPLSLSHDPVKSAEQSASLFWGLGDRWWMQIIDGSRHKYGPLVFDLGLHRGVAEPGYLESAKKACKFATRFEFSLTPYSYVDLHREACSHFRGGKTNTLIDQSETGNFAGERFTHVSIGVFLNIETIDLIDYFQAAKEDTEARVLFNKILIPALKSIKRLNREIAQRSQAIGFNPFAKTVYYNPFDETNTSPLQFDVNYLLPAEEKGAAVRRLFNEFRKGIREADTSDKKLTQIANLFQMLEWLHPFADGQGRTDLILLNKLLCDYGFNPAILERPYFSTHSSLESWTQYLKEGIEKWAQVKRRLEPKAMVDEG